MTTALSTYQNGLSQVSGDNLQTFEQVCPDVVTLRSFIGDLGMQVYLQGTASINDGGQGPFYWNASGTGPDDNGTTNIVPSGATIGCWTRLSFSSTLPSIANNTFLSNISGITATPIANTLTAFIDSAIGSTQGNILYRNSTSWVVLAPGTLGQLLQSGGVGGNPSWITASGTGTVTSISTNNGVTGGPITSSGTIGLSSIDNLNILSNISGSSAPPVQNTLTAIIDAAIGNTQGGILYRNSTQWVLLSPGSSGQVLQTQGAGANPQWAASSGSLVLLSSKTASTSATVDFTSLITATYDNYMVIFDNIIPATNSTYLTMLTSSDNGSNFATAANSYANSSNTADNTEIIVSSDSSTMTNNSTGGLSGKMFLYGLNTAAVFKKMESQVSFFSGGVGTTNLVYTANAAARRDSSNTVNATRFKFSAGNIASGIFKLYGIQN